MRILFAPQRRAGSFSLSKEGDTLTINGEAFDFSPLEDGATLPASAVDCEWITGEVKRIDGVIHLSVILPHGPNPPQHVAFPETLTVTEDGPVALPGEEDEH